MSTNNNDTTASDLFKAIGDSLSGTDKMKPNGQNEGYIKLVYTDPEKKLEERREHLRLLLNEVPGPRFKTRVKFSSVFVHAVRDIVRQLIRGKYVHQHKGRSVKRGNPYRPPKH